MLLFSNSAISQLLPANVLGNCPKTKVLLPVITLALASKWPLGSCPRAWAVALVDTWDYLGNCPYIMHDTSGYWWAGRHAAAASATRSTVALWNDVTDDINACTGPLVRPVPSLTPCGLTDSSGKAPSRERCRLSRSHQPRCGLPTITKRQGTVTISAAVATAAANPTTLRERQRARTLEAWWAGEHGAIGVRITALFLPLAVAHTPGSPGARTIALTSQCTRDSPPKPAQRSCPTT